MKEEENPWKTLKSKETYSNSWIKVTEHQTVNTAKKEGIYGVVHFKNIAIGIIPLDDSFNDLFQEKLDAAMAAGKYKNTYAATNIWEYWAEGVQNWFNVNAEVEKVDGKHNWVNTREDMKKYDPDLYKIVSNYFPEFEVSPSCHSQSNLYKE